MSCFLKKEIKMKKLIVIAMVLAVCFAAFASGASEGGQTTYELIMGTAGTSGTYYVVGAAMGTAVTNANPVLNVVVQPTKGSAENLRLASNNDIQLGFSNSDGIYWALTGTGTFASEGKKNIKQVMALYTSQCQMATLASSGIKTYGDLKGKKVSLGPSGQTIVEASKAVLRAYGIDPEKDITPYYLDVAEGLSKVTDGEIDACFWTAAAPTAGMVNATATSDVVLVDIDPEVLAKVCEEFPFYRPGVIPAGTYKGQAKDINVILMTTELFAAADVSEEAVYQFVKTALEHKADYVSAHVSAQEITPETAATVNFDVHPGALKYYKEIGLK